MFPAQAGVIRTGGEPVWTDEHVPRTGGGDPGGGELMAQDA